MLQASSLREVERLRQSSLQQSQRLDATQQRITDLETQLAKKEQVIREQKKLLENVKSQATYVVISAFIVLNHIENPIESESYFYAQTRCIITGMQTFFISRTPIT